MKSGFVSLIGRPNVGKSTLLNSLINSKIAITSNKPGTTRNIIQGIYNEEDYQIIFVDTPGIHKPINKLGKFLNKQAHSLINDIDIILFLVDASEDFGKGDKFILESLTHTESPVILVLNKIDKLNDEQILYKINEYKDCFPFAEIVPISATKKDNIDRLLKVTKKYLTDEIKYFDESMITSSSTNFMLSELVREKIFQLTEQEVPYSVTCYTVAFEEREDLFNVSVDIIVDRDALKRIIIGKNGEMLKEVGTRARIDMEELLGKKIYLELYVKTISNWRNKEKYLSELGFKDFE